MSIQQFLHVSAKASSSDVSHDESVINAVIIGNENDTSALYAGSTFFESSSLETNRDCNFFKPKFVMPTNFFPGDDIDEDIPWIGKNQSFVTDIHVSPYYKLIDFFSSVMFIMKNILFMTGKITRTYERKRPTGDGAFSKQLGSVGTVDSVHSNHDQIHEVQSQIAKKRAIIKRNKRKRTPSPPVRTLYDRSDET